jgi:hypothetical protein
VLCEERLTESSEKASKRSRMRRGVESGGACVGMARYYDFGPEEDHVGRPVEELMVQPQSTFKFS